MPLSLPPRRRHRRRKVRAPPRPALILSSRCRRQGPPMTPGGGHRHAHTCCRRRCHGVAPDPVATVPRADARNEARGWVCVPFDEPAWATDATRDDERRRASGVPGHRTCSHQRPRLGHRLDDVTRLGGHGRRKILRRREACVHRLTRQYAGPGHPTTRLYRRSGPSTSTSCPRSPTRPKARGHRARERFG